MTATATATPPPALMRMGCTNQLITYRNAGNEGVCLQSPDHGVQQIANFNPAAGDFLGVDDILEQTMAHADLSDVSHYITSQAVDGGTMLYVDLTGKGGKGTPFAFLQGVTTTVSQLVADGGMKYIPDAITVTPIFNTPLDLRPSGLATVMLTQMAPGVAAQQINYFNPATGDKLELANILNRTLAMPNLSDIAKFITVTNTGGNTTLSLDPTGHGGAGTAFAVLNGVTLTLNQLLGDKALLFDPTRVVVSATPGDLFTYRGEGAEMVMLPPVHANGTPAQLAGFSLGTGDGLNVGGILQWAGIQADLTNIQKYISTVQTGGNTQLWFDPTGSGHGGTLEAVLQNTSVTTAQLLGNSALSVLRVTGVIATPQFTMRMGCTNVTITYGKAGNEGVCLQDVTHGVQQLANFNPAAGDFLGMDDVLEQTMAHADLSDVAKYITSQVTGGGTMLYADMTGQGQKGTAFAFLQGVTTTVAQLVADGGMLYIPDGITKTPVMQAPVSLRPEGLTTVELSMPPGLGAETINFFDPTKADQLELGNILSHTLAQTNLSDIANYVKITNAGGNTTLSLDPTGHGQAGTAFAVLNGVTLTLPQLLADHALVYDPTQVAISTAPNTPFTYRSAGLETANLLNATTTNGVQQLSGFSLGAGDGINVARILGAADIQADLSNIEKYFSTVETGGNTQLRFDPTGSGHGGTLEAVLQHSSVTMSDLLSHSALHLTL